MDTLLLKPWTPSSWQALPALQQPSYRDPQALAAAVAALGRLPPIVVSWEVDALKAQLAEAQRGQRFILQGGDCAESFKEFHPDNIRDTFRALMQMAVILTFAGAKPVVKVGRIAGQFGNDTYFDFR